MLPMIRSQYSSITILVLISQILLYARAQVPGDCIAADLPTVSNADWPIPQTTKDYYTGYTCVYGYEPTGSCNGAGNPLGNVTYAHCSASTPYTWTTNNDTCSCTPIVTNFCGNGPSGVSNANSGTGTQKVNTLWSYTCDSGYVSSGGTSPYSQCLPQSSVPKVTTGEMNLNIGVWSPSSSTVTYKCIENPKGCSAVSAPSAPSNANTPTSVTLTNAFTYYTCNTGYTGTPPNYQCQNTSAYSGINNGNCNAINPYCLSQALTIAQSSCNPTTVATTVMANTPCTCAAGYTSSGSSDPFFTCMPNTAASGKQVQTYACAVNPTRCSGSPPAAVASITGSNTPAPQTYTGATMTYTCLTGYSGSPSYTCQASDGLYSSTTGACTLISSYCTGPATGPTIANSDNKFASSPNLNFMGLKTATCDKGYQSSDGTGATNTPYYQCLAATATSATGTYSAATYTCQPFWGYCDAASAPTLTSGGNANSPTPQTSVGSTTSFTCNPGYEYTGSLSYTCTAVGGGTVAGSGKWSPSTIAGTCTAIAAYCDSASATKPTLSKANNPTANTSVFQITSFTCQDGYSSSGGTTNPYYQCLPGGATASSGTWSKAVYSCVLNPTYCSGTPPNVTNANVPAPYRTIGITTTFTCLPGYQANIVAPATSLYYTCNDNTQASGSFSSATGTCDPIPAYCAATAPTPANTLPVTPNTAVYSITTLTCSAGYATSGPTSPYYQCMPGNASATGGVWGGTVFQCIDTADPFYCDINKALTLLDANFPIPYTIANTSTSFTCDLGYVSSIAPIAPYYTCGTGAAANGYFSTIYGTCDMIVSYCNSTPVPVLANANTPTPNTTVNSMTSFTCNNGYQSDGATNPYYLCLPGSVSAGIWSPGIVYTCVTIQNYCDPTTLPTVNNANSPTPYTTMGSKTYYTCAFGYQTTGAPTNPYVTCNANTATAGQWSVPIYTCQVFSGYCSGTVPSILNANAPAPLTTVFSTTYFTCNSGYSSSGATAPYYQCLPGTASYGIWSNSSYICMQKTNYCNMNTAPRLSNGLTGAAYATPGAVTSITCDEGYVSSTAPTAPFFTCNVGTATIGVWSLVYGTCVASASYCNTSSAPTIANANNPTPQTYLYAITTFTCDAAYESTGYQNSASPYYVCLPGSSSTGVWSPVTYGCQLIPNYCSNNPAESSSDLVASSSYFVASLGSQVNLSCSAGGVLMSGSLNVTCLYSTATTGLWSVATAKCYTSTSTLMTTTTVTTTTAWVPPWWIWTIVGVTCLIFLAFISLLSALLLFVYCSRAAARAASDAAGNFSAPSTPRRIKLRNAVSPVLK